MPGTVPSLPSVHFLEVELGDYAVRGAVIVGETRALVWDTLSHPRDMAAVAALARGREVVVAYSHADWDHVWGTAGLGEPPAAIIAHQSAPARFATDVPATLAAKRAEEPGRWDAVRLIPPTVTFTDSLTLDLGGLTVELSALPGHTPDSIAAFIPERGLLLPGDAVETPLPCLQEGSPLPAWTAALERWRADPRVAHVVPCHGDAGDREVIAHTLGYLRSLTSGAFFPLPENLPAFYRHTHADNLRFAAVG